MPDTDNPILVVDDAKFSSAIIAKVLRGGGFSNVRFTDNPMHALRSLEKRPAGVIIADWLMPAMGGVELTKRVKKLDDASNRFTYVMLMTARDEFEAMESAFNDGVDDFINKANLRDQLLPRVVAANRIATRQNALLRENRVLNTKVRELQTTDLVDPVTGLGNLKFTIDRLTDLLKQSETRGGAACLLMIGVNNINAILNQYEQSSVDELMSAMATKIRRLIRPLDVVTRPERDTFAVIIWQDELKNCTSKSFRRIFDSLYMHSFRTSEGYILVVVGVSISAADASTGHPHAQELMNFGYEALTKSFDTGSVTVLPYNSNLSSQG